MATQSKLVKIAARHYANGEKLFTHASGLPGHYHGACYISGYTIETMFKAALCQATGTPDYDHVVVLDPATRKKRRHKIHDPALLYQLLSENCPPGRFVDTLSQWNPAHQPGNPVFDWSEQTRYAPGWRANRRKARKFLDAVRDFYITVSKEM